ncbi:hypothetical protein [Vreelandella sp. EE22]
MAIAAAATCTTGGGGIKKVQKVDVVIVQCRQQGIDVVIQHTGFVGGDDNVVVEFRGQLHGLPPFNDVSACAIAEIELDTATVRGDQGFTLDERVADLHLVSVTLAIRNPGVPSDRDDRCCCHLLDPQ